MAFANREIIKNYFVSLKIPVFRSPQPFCEVNKAGGCGQGGSAEVPTCFVWSKALKPGDHPDSPSTAHLGHFEEFRALPLSPLPRGAALWGFSPGISLGNP